MTKIALIDKAPNRTDYVAHFKNEFEFDQYHLCSEQKKKILKRDVDIEIDLDEYDWIILVGSEALLTSRTGFSTSLTREPGEFSGSTPTTQPPPPRTSWVTVHRWTLYWPNTVGLQELNGVSLQQVSPLHLELPFTETRYLSRRTAME